MIAAGIQPCPPRKSPLIALAALAWACASLVAQPALAQRGRDYIEQNPPPEGPSSGFPGFLDTEVAASGSFVLDGSALTSGAVMLPNLGVDYGLTENLSVGTSLITPLLFAAGISNLYLKFRYRLHSSGPLVTTLTLYGGMSEAARADSLLLVRPDFALSTLNASYAFTERLGGLAHFLAFHTSIYQGVEGTLASYKAELSAVMLGIGARFQLLRSLGTQLSVLYPLYGSYSEDQATYSGITTPDLLSISGGNVPFRFGMDYRFAHDWIASGGCYGALVGSALMLVPFANVAVKL